MPRFSYKAVHRDGRPTAGEIDAPSLNEARAQLEQQGLKVDALKPVEALSTEAPPAGHVKLTANEIEQVGERIAELTRAQLPLAPGLAAMAEEMPTRRLKQGMRAISRKLEGGASLEDALSVFGAPKELQAVLRAGARSGRSAEIMAGYVAHLRSRSAYKLVVAMSLGYPLALLLASGGIILFFMMSLVPSFKKIFEDFGTELPGITLLLISMSDFLWSIGWKLIVGTVLAILIVAVITRLVRGPGVWKPIFRMLPVVGPLLHWSAMARFCHILAEMIDNQVPLPEALQLAGDGTNDAGIRAACREMIVQVSQGAPPAPSEYLVSGFPAAIIRTLTEHKQTEALPDTLHAVADMFDKRSRLQGNLALFFLGPLILILTGAWLLLTVFAMFMPLIKLLNDLA